MILEIRDLTQEEKSRLTTDEVASGLIFSAARYSDFVGWVLFPETPDEFANRIK